MIVYYSGTGNSRWCANKLAEYLQEETVDIFHFVHDGIAADLITGKPWVFVAPVYAWQMAHVMQDFIRSGSFMGSRDAYFVLTCGAEMGGAAAADAALCAEKDFSYRGTAEVVMPNNYVVSSDAPEPAEARTILRKAEPVLQQIAAKIAAGENLPEGKIGLLNKLKSGPVNSMFTRYADAKQFSVLDHCVSCGKCAEGCIKHNIQMVNGKPVWGKDCIQCLACICGCPVSAIEYGKGGKRTHYHCPE